MRHPRRGGYSSNRRRWALICITLMALALFYLMAPPITLLSLSDETLRDGIVPLHARGVSQEVTGSQVKRGNMAEPYFARREEGQKNVAAPVAPPAAPPMTPPVAPPVAPPARQPVQGDTKYLLFLPHDGNWNDIRMSWEMAIAWAYASGRTLVIPPKYKMTSLNAVIDMTDMMDTSRLAELVPIIEFEKWTQIHAEGLNDPKGDDEREPPRWGHGAQTTQLKPKYEHVHRVAEIARWPELWKIVLCSPRCDPSNLDLQTFAGERERIDLTHPIFQINNLFLPGNTFGVFYTNVWFEDRQRLQRLLEGIRDFFTYNQLVRTTASRIADELGGVDKFFAVNVHRFGAENSYYRPESRVVANNMKVFLQPNETIFLFTNEPSTSEYFTAFNQILLPNHTVKRVGDFKGILEGVPGYLHSAIEQQVCSLSRIFMLTLTSPYSSYVQRLRGYRMGRSEPLHAIIWDFTEEDPSQYSFGSRHSHSIWAYEYRLGWDFNPTDSMQIDPNTSQCEQTVNKVLNIPTHEKLPEKADQQKEVTCKKYRKYLAKSLCTKPPGEGHSEVFSTPEWDAYIEQIRPVVTESAVDGKYVFFTLQHLADRAFMEEKIKNNIHARFQHPDKMREYANVTAVSFAHAYGKQPLFVCDDDYTMDEMKKLGINYVIKDTTPWWRTTTVAGNRRTSRSTITKYFFIYFILRLGFIPTFFDSDGYHLRKVDLVTNSGEVDVVFNMEYGHQVMPRRQSANKNEFSGLVREFFSTNTFAWCPPNVDHVPINTGYMTWYPNPNTFRLLTNQIDFIVKTPEWWEQNLLTFMHYHHTLFGLRVGFWDANAVNRYGMKVNCTGTAPSLTWVHTKHTDTYPTCLYAVKHYPPKNVTDIRPATITLHLQEPFKQDRGEK